MDDISTETWNKAEVTAINVHENDDVIDKKKIQSLKNKWTYKTTNQKVQNRQSKIV